jgi:hypothetical protein
VSCFEVALHFHRCSPCADFFEAPAPGGEAIPLVENGGGGLPCFEVAFYCHRFPPLHKIFSRAEFPAENEAIPSIENGDGSLSSFEVALHFHCFSPFLGI